jgi:hypothetical protein
MVTGTGILDAQNSWHGDHNYRDRTGRQQKINNTPPSPFGLITGDNDKTCHPRDHANHMYLPNSKAPMKPPLTFLFLAIALSLLFTACSRLVDSGISPPPGISVEAVAWQDNYFNMVSRGFGSTNTQPEYKVQVTLRNTGNTSIKWDRINTDFYPEKGRRLSQPRFAFDPKKGANQNAYAKGAKQIQELKPGASLTIEARTNGHTLSLLRDASDSKTPLNFSVTLFRNDKALTDSFVAPLPFIGELPCYLPPAVGKVEPVKLEFTQQLPQPTQTK